MARFICYSVNGYAYDFKPKSAPEVAATRVLPTPNVYPNTYENVKLLFTRSSFDVMAMCTDLWYCAPTSKSFMVFNGFFIKNSKLVSGGLKFDETDKLSFESNNDAITGPSIRI